MSKNTAWQEKHLEIVRQRTEFQEQAKADGFRTHWLSFFRELIASNLVISRVRQAAAYLEGRESFDLKDFNIIAINKHCVKMDNYILEVRESNYFGYIHYWYRFRSE